MVADFSSHLAVAPYTRQRPLGGQAVWKRPEISVLVIPPWANLL